MSIKPIQFDGAAAGQAVSTEAAFYSLVRENGAGPGETTAPADQVIFRASADLRFNQRQLRHEHDNSLAAAIRDSDRGMEALGQKIDALKAPLDAIVKNFPPFSPEDKERMELLREYSAIRKEIDRLTFPPPPEIAQARQAVAIPPALQKNADDSQIADHIAKLDAAAASLGGQRAALAADTASYLQQWRFSELNSSPNHGESASSGPVLTESAAAQKSAEVGRQFAHSVRQGVTLDHSKFLKGIS